MESLRKYLKRKKNTQITVTTLENIYTGTGKEISKKASNKELLEIVTSEEYELFTEDIYVYTDSVDYYS